MRGWHNDARPHKQKQPNPAGSGCRLFTVLEGYRLDAMILINGMKNQAPASPRTMKNCIRPCQNCWSFQGSFLLVNGSFSPFFCQQGRYFFGDIDDQLFITEFRGIVEHLNIGFQA